MTDLTSCGGQNCKCAERPDPLPRRPEITVKPIGHFIIEVMSSIVRGRPFYLSPSRRIVCDRSKVDGHLTQGQAAAWLADNPPECLGLAPNDEIRILQR